MKTIGLIGRINAKEGDCRAPLFPTTKIHAVAAVEKALEGA